MPGAWTSPRTWTNGEMVVDTQLNTHVRDNLLWLGGTAGIVTANAGTSSNTSESTTSATPVALVAPILGFTPQGGDVLVWGSIGTSNTTGGAENLFYLAMDSASPQIFARYTTPTANYHQTITMLYRLVAPAAGAHTFGFYWSCSTGTLSTDTAISRVIVGIELRR